MDTYSVIYEGLAPDTDTATAEANFAKLFKITPEKATTILGKRG